MKLKNDFPSKIAIMGVGLIGGSIALALKKQLGNKITIWGSCSTLKKSLRAKKAGIIDKVFTNTAIPPQVTFLIIATPILTTIEILKSLSNKSQQLFIIDIGSTKELICHTALKTLPKNLFFLGTHPMAGKEKSGFENADSLLFKNKPWIICPTRETKNEQLCLVKKLIQILGAKPIIMEAKTHDQICSWASHLFLTLANILVKTESKENIWNKISKIASSGFYDTTRLASHNTEMKRDIILTNKKNIINSLLKLNKEIKRFVKMIKDNKNDMLLQYLTDTKETRDKLLLSKT